MKDFGCAYPRIKEILVKRGISKDILARMCFENSRYLSKCIKYGELSLEKQHKILNALHLDPHLVDWYFQKNVREEKVEVESKPTTNSENKLLDTNQKEVVLEFNCPLCKAKTSVVLGYKFAENRVACPNCGTKFSTEQKYLSEKIMKYNSGLEIKIFTK